RHRITRFTLATPVILQNFEQMLTSFSSWQKGGCANVDFLRGEYGNMTVPVVESSSGTYGEQKQTSMTLADYFDMIEAEALVKGENIEVEGEARNTPGDHSFLAKNERPLPYLKDWHFQRMCGMDQAKARDEVEGERLTGATGSWTPSLFADDWLNWWWDRKGHDDYRFVYIGPRGTWTPLHHDVLNSYSWSANICGRKHWTLFPPEETPKLYDRHGQNLVPDIREGGARESDFPHLSEAVRVEVVQEAGEAIFVPSGWHHQARSSLSAAVVNLGSGERGDSLTLSVNTNWFNGFNIGRVSKFLRSELNAVHKAIEHLREDMSHDGDGRDWERQCELIMRANSALNLTDFAGLVCERVRHIMTYSCNQDVSLPSQADQEGQQSERNDSRICEGLGKWEEGVWELRWRLHALEQAAVVLQELSTKPSIDHIFLGEG
ncbi:unnamed protein product, partial [Choristocarpus tenellus]